jgi:hypothetical protein
MKSRRLGFAGHVARMEEGRNDFKILVASLYEWSARLTSNHEIESSIPSTSTILKVN